MIKLHNTDNALDKLLSILIDWATLYMMFYFSNRLWGFDGMMFVLGCIWFSSIQVRRIKND